MIYKQYPNPQAVPDFLYGYRQFMVENLVDAKWNPLIQCRITKNHCYNNYMSLFTNPKSKFSKLSIRLNTAFVLITVSSIMLVKVFGLLSFGDHWWDVTVLLLAILSISALVTGLVALFKKETKSRLLYFSIAISAATFLFVLLHSLFIND